MADELAEADGRSTTTLLTAPTGWASLVWTVTFIRFVRRRNCGWLAPACGVLVVPAALVPVAAAVAAGAVAVDCAVVPLLAELVAVVWAAVGAADVAFPAAGLVAEAALVGAAVVLVAAGWVEVAAGAVDVFAGEVAVLLAPEALAVPVTLGLAAAAGVPDETLVGDALFDPVAGIPGVLVHAPRASAAIITSVDSKVNFFIYSNPPAFLL